MFFEVSAKDNDNIKRMLYRSVSELHIFDDVEDKSSLAEQLEIENYNLKVSETEENEQPSQMSQSVRDGTNVNEIMSNNKNRKCAC